MDIASGPVSVRSFNHWQELGNFLSTERGARDRDPARCGMTATMSARHHDLLTYRLLNMDLLVAQRRVQDVRDVVVTRTLSAIGVRPCGVESMLEAYGILKVRFVFFIPFFFPSVCSSKQQASPLSNPLVVGAPNLRLLQCSAPCPPPRFPSFVLPCDSKLTLRSPCRGSICGSC